MSEEDNRRLFNILKWDAKKIAYETGEELLQIKNQKTPWRQKRLNARFDYYLNKIMDESPNQEDIVKIVYCWCHTFQIIIYEGDAYERFSIAASHLILDPKNVDANGNLDNSRWKF